MRQMVTIIKKPTLQNWSAPKSIAKIKETTALRTKSWTGGKEGIMYTREQKEKALAMYDATQSIAEVIRRLGYPSKQALYTWIANREKPWTVFAVPLFNSRVSTAQFKPGRVFNLDAISKYRNIIFWWSEAAEGSTVRNADGNRPSESDHWCAKELLNNSPPNLPNIQSCIKWWIKHQGSKAKVEKLILQSGGTPLRAEMPHQSPNPHTFHHINYLTSRGIKGTLRVLARGFKNILDWEKLFIICKGW